MSRLSLSERDRSAWDVIVAIVLFAGFWAIQSEELWDEGLRPVGTTV